MFQVSSELEGPSDQPSASETAEQQRPAASAPGPPPSPTPGLAQGLGESPHLQAGPFRLGPRLGQVKGYSHAAVSVDFDSTELGAAFQMVQIRFAPSGASSQAIPPRILELRATGVNAAIAAETEVVDFKVGPVSGF